MELSTREKIIVQGKKRFNQNGFGATTLYQIAQDLYISRGNLTYYFKTKDDLLAAITEEMTAKYRAKMVEFQFPTWENTNNATKAFHQLQREYAFIFMDKQVMTYPLVQLQIQRTYEDDLQRQLSMISFSIQVGNMREEVIPGTYHNLCRTLWMNAFFWQLSDIYQDVEKETGWDKVAWSLVLPHFTEKGLTAFKQHFGEDYYLSLGKVYESYATKAISF
ncbi:MAG: TetR/AcrR family transcriptional regulator [Bacteroidota bacterium]